jgi:hypothetical protein
MLLDKLDDAGAKLIACLSKDSALSGRIVSKSIKREHKIEAGVTKGFEKLIRNAPLILAGLLIGSLFNSNACYVNSNPEEPAMLK